MKCDLVEFQWGLLREKSKRTKVKVIFEKWGPFPDVQSVATLCVLWTIRGSDCCLLIPTRTKHINILLCLMQTNT